MSTLVPRNRVDPTGTHTLRRKYAQKLRGGFADLNTSIRQGILEDDVLGLDIDVLSDPPNKDFRFLSNSRKEAAFNEWLDTAIEQDILTKIDRDGNTYIRSAYSKGVQDADRALRSQGVTVPDADLNDIFNMGVHQNALEDLYTRNFENLKNITTYMSDEMGEELAKGLAEGKGPGDIARNITNRVDKVGKHRATLLARTEVINAYSGATLNRYERLNVGTVTITAEWLTAGDDRVCPICQTLEGQTWTIQEAREDTFQFNAGPNEPSSLTGEYPVKPPTHVQCRCRVIPNVS